MKNNHSKIKTILSYCGIISFAGILVFCTSFSVYAARINDYANSPNDLATIQRYNKAMETCIPGGLGGGFSYDTSGSGDYKLENMQKSYDRLMGKQYFFNEYSGSLIYSEEFEKNVSQGNYDGGIFGSGNNDGKMYCGENNSILLDKSLGVFGLSKDADTLKSLYCNGNNDGIYKITKKKYDSNYKVVKEDSNCAENFDLFVKYANNKTTDPEYSISVSVADDAGNYYKQWFKQKVGDFSKLSSDQQKALEYAEASHNLQMLCSATGPSETSFGSKSEVTAYDATGKKVYYQIGVDADEKFYTGIDSKTEQTCADMAGQMNEDAAKAFAAVVGTVNPSDPNNPSAPPIDDGTVSSTEDPCYSGDIESMSWILCPATTNMAKATDGLNGMIEDMLAVNTNLYSRTDENGEKSGTYQAWEFFRDIANVAIIIVILAVIFSQITGVGIDNYGIKKILPKLIAGAILINLSYTICVIAIDISNILGSGLNLMLQSIGKTIGVENYGQITISSLVMGILGAVTAVGAGASIALEGITLLGTSGATTMVLIIPLIIALIIAIVAVVMFYVMLGARMIIIILFTAVSPLAFACNILPNTQKIFKKWLDVMKAALLMFPICGALYGLSFIIKAIVFSSDGIHIWMGIVAVFSPFLPFLVLPTLLRNAISALGVVGNKLMGVGDTMKGSLKNAQSAVRNSDQYRTQAQLGQLEHANWRARRTLEGTAFRRGLNNITGRPLTKSEQVRKLEAQRAINTYETEMADAAVGVPVIDNGTAMMRAQSRLQAQETKNWSEQFARAKSSDIQAAFIDALAKNNVAKSSAAFAALKETGNLPMIHSALTSRDASGNSVWSNMSDDMRLSLNQDMIRSGDVAMKAYAKRSFRSDNKGDFAKFMQGEAQDGIADFGTLASELGKLGSHALDGQDKDSLEFIAKNIASQTDGGAGLRDAGIAKMIMSGVTSTQNGEERSRFIDMINNYSAKIGNSAQFASEFGNAITTSQLAKMDSKVLDALNDACGGNSQAGNYDAIRRMLSSSIQEIQLQNNATLLASMSNSVKTKIGIPIAASNGGGIDVPHNNGGNPTPSPAP